MCNIIENSASPAREIVVIVDFNCVESCELDRLNANYPDSSARALRNIKAKFNRFDTFKYLRPEEKIFTFVSNRGQASRIDRVYAQDTLLRYLGGTDNPPNVYSDHTFLKLEFDFNEISIGPGLWRLNTNLLNVLSFRQKIESFWTGWRKRKSQFPNLASWWDAGKRHIRLIANNTQKQASKGVNSHYRNLYKRLRNAVNGAKYRSIIALNRQISNLNRSKIHSYFLGKKIEWKERGEKCNSHFFEHHRNPRERDIVHHILTSKGSTTSDTKEILAEFTSFYEELYEETPVEEEAQNQVLNLLNSRLGAGQAVDCSHPYRVKDLKRAILNLPSQKSPGSDGILVEFYNSFYLFIFFSRPL